MYERHTNSTFNQLSTPEPDADLPGFVDTESHQTIRQVFGDHIHDNDGTHLTGGLPEEVDKKWQDWYKSLIATPSRAYTLRRNGTSKRFLSILTEELQNVRKHRTANFERVLVFIMVILESTPHIKRQKDINRRLNDRLDLWLSGNQHALYHDTVLEKAKRDKPSKRAFTLEERARRFDAMLKSGRTKEAMQLLTSTESKGVLDPEDIDPKTNRKVIEVLRDKHPELRTPDLNTTEGRLAFEQYDFLPDAVPLRVSAETIATSATKLKGSGGPSGTDAVTLKNWLLGHGKVSFRLRCELAHWTEWLANHSPPYAAIRALLNARLIGLDKSPGVRPIAIEEIFRRLMAKTVAILKGDSAAEECGNLNLCTGLSSGTEGSIHAMLKFLASPNQEALLEKNILLEMGFTDEEAQDLESNLEEVQKEITERLLDYEDDLNRKENYDENDPEAVLLIDARNAFNELSRFSMLWTVRHLWPAGARFVFNCYRHASTLFVRRDFDFCEEILSREGIAQGDPLSMILYGLTLTPIAEKIRENVKDIVQPFYADDVALAGKSSDISKAMEILMQYGPARGYFPELNMFADTDTLVALLVQQLQEMNTSKKKSKIGHAQSICSLKLPRNIPSPLIPAFVTLFKWNGNISSESYHALHRYSNP